MKNTTVLPEKSRINVLIQSFVIICCSLLGSVKAFAQSVPEKVDVDISTNSGPAWYGQPWFWAIGVAVFIVIIVAITRRGNA